MYLGRDPSKINLEELKKKFPEDIENSESKLKKFLEKNRYIKKTKKDKIKENKFLNEEQIIEIEAILEHYKKRFNNKTKKDKETIIKKLDAKFIAENVSLEFEDKKKFNFREIEKILYMKTFPYKRSVRKILEITKTKEILDYLKNENPEINLKLILYIQNNLTQPYNLKGFRNIKIKTSKKEFITTHPNKINSELKEIMSWYNKNKNKIHPLVMASLFHHKFERIHPFLIQNGETGRILMNYMLSELGYPPIIIKYSLNKNYVDSMNKAYPCLKKNLLSTDMRYYDELINFMYKQFVKTYWENFA